MLDSLQYCLELKMAYPFEEILVDAIQYLGLMQEANDCPDVAVTLENLTKAFL